MAVSIVAHSEKQRGSWSRDKNMLSVICLAKAATFYYGKHRLFVCGSSSTKKQQDDELGQLDKAVCQWLQGKASSFKSLSKYTEGENAAEWWEENGTENPEISRLASFLLDCPVQGAACERLFKDFALFHTKQRNRLKADTVYKSTLVKHMMNRKYPDDRAQCESTRHTNRIVRAEQYPRKNLPSSPPPLAAAPRGAARIMAEVIEDEQEQAVSAALARERLLEDAETAAAADEDDDEEDAAGPSLVEMLGNKNRGGGDAGNND
jgi:hypothetical protein